MNVEKDQYAILVLDEITQLLGVPGVMYLLSDRLCQDPFKPSLANKDTREATVTNHQQRVLTQHCVSASTRLSCTQAPE